MIEKMVLKKAILEPLFGTGKAGANEFGLIGGGIQSGSGGGQSNGLLSGLGSGLSGLFSGNATSTATDLTPGGLFHEGGIVGDGGPRVGWNSGVFAGAHRYHQGGIAGLLPGEVPAILKEGEGVFTEKQMQNGGAGGGHTFNVNIQTPDPQSFRESSGQIHAMLAGAVARGQRNL